MPEKDLSRRKFILATISFSGLISTGMATSVIRSGSAWAQSGQDNAGDLARLARLLFPHAAISDDVYSDVIDGILMAASTDASLTNALDDADAALNSATGGDWADVVESDQIEALQSIESESFFNQILANVKLRFYNHPKVWEHIGYPGSSVEFGGYVDRGFDDIDWLPEDA